MSGRYTRTQEHRAAAATAARARWADPAFRAAVAGRQPPSERHKAAISKGLKRKWRDRDYRAKQEQERQLRFGRLLKIEVRNALTLQLAALPVDRFIQVCRALLESIEARQTKTRIEKEARQLQRAVEKWNEQLEKQKQGINGNVR